MQIALKGFEQHVPDPGAIHGRPEAVKRPSVATTSRRKRSARGCLPEHAEAIISRPCRSAMTSGRARTKRWVLRFVRRTPPSIEPLMGWTGGDEPLAHVELAFPSLEAALGYAEREGLTYHIQASHDGGRAEQEALVDHLADKAVAALLTLSWMRAQHGACDELHLLGLERAHIDPAAVFRSPDEVLDHPLLSKARKKDILQRWAWDEYLSELASAEAMPEAWSSRLAEVKSALTRLESGPAPDAVLVFSPENSRSGQR